MRPEIDLSEEEKRAVESYACAEGYLMKHAYAQLIRDALATTVSIDFGWGGDGEFAVRVQYDSKTVFYPVSEDTDRSGERVISEENKNHTSDGAGLVVLGGGDDE